MKRQMAVVLAGVAGWMAEGFAQSLQTEMLPPGAGSDLLSTNAAQVAPLVVNIGQLAGITTNGVAIADVEDLLPLTVQSLTVQTPDGASVVLDAQGVLALDVTAGSLRFVDENGQPHGLARSWTEAADQIDWSSVTNRPPVGNSQIADGTIAPEKLSFTPLTGAAGAPGSIQFNENGQLAGNTNLFIHAETGKLAFYAQEGNLFRAFKGGEVSDANMIYVLRRYEDTIELCLLQNGEQTVRLRGDGSIYASGTLNVGGLSLGGGETSGSTGWFIPEEGDLSMGPFTQE